MSDVQRDRHRCGYSIDGRRLWVDLCRSYTQLVLVKSDANDWSGRMQMCEQIGAPTQQPKHGSSAEFMGPLAGDSHWGNSNPDLFTDSSGYRGFRLRLYEFSRWPSPSYSIQRLPALIDTAQVSEGGGAPLLLIIAVIRCRPPIQRVAG